MRGKGLGPRIKSQTSARREGSRVVGRCPLVIKKTVSGSTNKGKGPLVDKQSAREALVTRSPPGVRVNKIGPRVSGLGPYVMGKCPLKRNMSAALGKGPSVSLVGRKVRTSCSNDQNSSCRVLENENGQRLRGIRPHTMRAKWSVRTKRLACSWQRSACNRKPSSARNKDRSAGVSIMNQIGSRAS